MMAFLTLYALERSLTLDENKAISSSKKVVELALLEARSIRELKILCSPEAFGHKD